MKTLLLLIPFALLFGCATKERCLKRFPPQQITDTHIITETIETFRDTTIFVSLPGASVTFFDTILVDRVTGLPKPAYSFLETSLSWSSAEIKQGFLFHDLHQKDTLIEVELQNAINEIVRLQSELSYYQSVIEVPRELSNFQHFAVWFTTFSFIAIAIFLIFLLLRLRSKLPL